MESTDLTLTILQNIRSDIAALGGRFDHLEGRFGTLEGEVAAMRKDMQTYLTRDEFRGALMAMNIAADERFERGERRTNEIDARATTSYQELQDTIRQLMAQLGQHGSLAARVSLCERDIVDVDVDVDVDRKGRVL